MMITFHTTIHNSGISLFPDSLLGDFMVYPVRVPPHAIIDLSKLNGSASIILNGVFELLVKISVIQKDVRIMPPSVEMTFN